MNLDRTVPATPAPRPAAGGSSLARMLAILDVIETGGLALDFEALQARLGLTRSTLYRYLKSLIDAGLVAALPEVGYTLGPRIAELDHALRAHDPLIIAARPVMAELVRAVPGIALLCRRYRDKVLCVHQEAGTDAFRSSFERGRPQPLLRGAASRIILAHLPPYAVARLHAAQPGEFAAAGLGDTREGVRATLRAIRQTGIDISESQLIPDVTGIAAPVFDNRGAVVGSLSLTLGRTGLAAAELAPIADRVRFCAGIVTEAIARREG